MGGKRSQTENLKVKIENDKGYPVKLKKGSVLGRVISVREVNENEVLFEAAADPTS